jgi:2-hydroxychromene-2-carboxylate isomerase
MSIKSVLVSRVANHMLSEKRERALRGGVEATRRKAGGKHVITYFHQVDDPYSHLAVQSLNLLMSRYSVLILVHLVGPPADWATPERVFLQDYARHDCARLAQKASLSFPDVTNQPEAASLAHAQSLAAAALTQPNCLELLMQIGQDMWTGQKGETVPCSRQYAEAIKRGQARCDELGHFMSAMIYYGGEWYWGLDRLHYLEARLTQLRLKNDDTPDVIWSPPELRAGAITLKHNGKVTLEFFLSFRSPYTYIATKRAKALADAYGLELKLRFVLPMLMRGLVVPPMKSRYFSLDTAREARRLNIPFGRICDPLGKPVERGYAILPWAIEQGHGYAFCLAFMESVWSKGIDAGTDSGLAKIVQTAGLDWKQAKQQLGKDAWRQEAEANRLALLELGHWGVPCFKYDDTIIWGQDRLWVIEDAIRAKL